MSLERVDAQRLADLLRDSGIVVVDFSAVWCAGCHATMRTLGELSEELPEVTFVDVDVAAHPALSEGYDVGALPTVAVFADGVEIARIAGARGERQLRRRLAGVLEEGT